MKTDPPSRSVASRLIFLPALLILSLLPATSALAQLEEEMDILRMIYKDQDLVTPARTPKPISQVAENVTVIDADEIEAINAHTLTDVLLYVTGVQMDVRGGPGAASSAHIQGSEARQVQLMVDGVSLNNLAGSIADFGAFPVQRIERIEIIKGPASSTWGSSLGGIINIITRSPDPLRPIGGVVSASIGERGTGDYRLDLSGVGGDFGYYLSLSGISGDGVSRNTPYDAVNLYSKLQWDPTYSTRLQLALSYDIGGRGDSADPSIPASFGDSFEYFYLAPSFTWNIFTNMNMEVSARLLSKRNKQFVNDPGSGAELFRSISDEIGGGGSVKFNWRKGISNLLVGSDYDYGTVETAAIKDGEQIQDRWAVFANDTLSFGDLSVTPGVRYDHTRTSGSFISPSLGITYNLMERTILRLYGARGFNAPPLFDTFGDGFFSVANPGLKEEEVWSLSGGFETSAARYFWVKATGFLHYIRDFIDSEVVTADPPTFRSANVGKQKRQGVEVELRTVPLFHTSLMTGYAFIDARDRETGERIPNIPRHTWDVGIDYDNKAIVKGSLRGHYIWWNAESGFNGKYNAMIWDLNLSRCFLERGKSSLEAFFTAHNLFNGSQYLIGVFPNARRWFEGGVRWRF